MDCIRRDVCGHSKKHIPKDGNELLCIQRTTDEAGNQHKEKSACPGCTWVGKGENPYSDRKKFISKLRRRTLWTPISTPLGVSSLADMIDEGRDMNEILKEEGILI
jgi:hypothetical protein